MVGCCVPECQDYKEKRSRDVKFHRFPLSDPERTKQWLVKIANADMHPGMDHSRLEGKRICSEHFTPDDYKRDLQAELLCGPPKRHLNDSAIPSIFPGRERKGHSDDAVPSTSSGRTGTRSAFAKRRHHESLRAMGISPVKPVKSKRKARTSSPIESEEELQSSSQPVVLEDAEMQEAVSSEVESTTRSPLFTPTVPGSQKGISFTKPCEHFGTVKHSSPIEIEKELTESVQVEAYPGTSRKIIYRRPRIGSDESLESEPSQMVFSESESPSGAEPLSSPDPADESWHISDSPESSSTSYSNSSSSDANADDPKRLRMYLVTEQSLMDLLKLCPVCGAAIITKTREAHKVKLTVKWTCASYHEGVWESMPDVRGMASGNLLCAGATLFSGATFSDISEFAYILNLQYMSRSYFNKIQSKYLLPAVEEEYLLEHNAILAELMLQDETPVSVHGDGRSHSPGFSAKYTSYSFMDERTTKIIDTQLVQKTEASSSVMMEKVGFIRSLQHLLENNVPVQTVTTDRSPSIRKLLREEYEELDHQLDIWHVSKGLKKKLVKSAKRKGHEALFKWIKCIVNHLWWCCSNCNGDKDKLKQQWTSLLYHVRDIHQWEEGGQVYSCSHQELSLESRARTDWLSSDSPAFKALWNTVMDRNIAKDLDQMTEFKHTGSLEVFHNELLRFATKRLHFSYPVMGARLKLAILDHNENVNRPVAINKDGMPALYQVFSKVSGVYTMKEMKVPKTKNYAI